MRAASDTGPNDRDPDRWAESLAGLRRLADRLAAGRSMLDAMSSENDIGLVATDEVDRVTARLEELDASIRARTGDHQRARVEQIVRDANGEALRLNIGSGPNRVDGWINLDISHGDVQVDIREPLPFHDGSASHIYAAHVIEHLRRHEAHHFLLECRRVLRRGGKLRVVVPDIGHYLQACLDNDDAFWATHQRTWPWSRVEANRLDQTLRYAGAGPLDNDFFGHRHGYDGGSLSELLASAGFSPIRLCRYQASKDELFRIDDQSAVAHVTHDGRPLSLFAEAFSIF